MSSNSSPKILLFCYSYHTLSTKKLCEGIKQKMSSIDLVLLKDGDGSMVTSDVDNYDYIGFASGIYFWDYGKPIYEQVKKIGDFKGKKCFVLTTSGSASDRYNYYLREEITKRNGNFVGGWGCKGYGNYFPLNLFGGSNPGKPDEMDIEKACNFISGLISS